LFFHCGFCQGSVTGQQQHFKITIFHAEKNFALGSTPEGERVNYVQQGENIGVRTSSTKLEISNLFNKEENIGVQTSSTKL
jgi:hypothetical protein